MIGVLSPAAVLRTLERERLMLEGDLVHQRLPSPLEASSILSFCWFVEALRQGWPTFAVPAPPPAHLAFYRTTLQRLVSAGELPAGSEARFDTAFRTEKLAVPQMFASGDSMKNFDHMTHEERFLIRATAH